MIKAGRSRLYGLAKESISQYFFQRGSWTKALCIMWQLETRQISHYFHHRVIGNFLIFCIIKADQRVSFINLFRNCVFNFNILQFEFDNIWWFVFAQFNWIWSDLLATIPTSLAIYLPIYMPSPKTNTYFFPLGKV